MSLKPAPASLRDLPRAPPGALPPAPGGYGGGLPPAPGRGGYATPPGGGYGGGAPRPTTQLPARGGTGGGAGPQHPTGLPPNLLSLFEPRPPLEYMPPPARPKKTLALTGIAALVGEFEDPKRGDEKASEEDDDARPAETSARVPVGLETRDARARRIAREKKARHAERLKKQLETYDPKRDANIPKETDPYKTLFVGRLSYDADEATLRREFETFGDVRTVTIPRVRKGTEGDDAKDAETQRHCGYAFVEYAREDDMKAAYRGANGRTVEGRRIVVDAERGRAVPDWRPRRLGGGVGRGRLEKPKKGKKGLGVPSAGAPVGHGSYDDGYRRDDRRDDRRAPGARGSYASDRGRDGDGFRRDDRRGRSDRGGYGDDGERFGVARGGSDRDRGYGRDRGTYERDRDRRRDYGRDAYDRRDSARRDYGRDLDGGGRDGYKRDRSPDDRRGGYDAYDRGKRARDDGYGAPPPPPAAPDSPEEGEL